MAIEVTLSMVAWMTVVIFQALVHYGVFSSRRSKGGGTDTGTTEVASSVDPDRGVGVRKGEDIASSSLSSSRLEEPSNDVLMCCKQQEQQQFETFMEEDDEDDFRNNATRLEEEPEEIQRLLLQTGKEMVSLSRSERCILERAQEQLRSH